MKSLIPLMFFTLFLNAQENVSIAFYQDVKLAVSNDNHGNTAPTLDFKIDVSLQGKQFDNYYFEIRPQFEYAELSGGKYVSWLINGGWTFNRLFIKNLEISGYLTTGTIHRFGTSWLTYGLTTDLSYKIGRFKISVMPQAIKRFELENKKFGISVYGGIKYEILN